VFDRLPVLSWLRSLLSDVIERPSHAPEKAIPIKTINVAGLQEHLRGASSLTLSSISLQGARDADRAVSASRLIRDFCEDQGERSVRLMVCSGLPLSQAPLSTLDRQVIDILLPLEANGQLSVCLVPRSVLELAPRIAVVKGDKTVEYYATNFDQPIFDDLLGSAVYLSNAANADDWQERNKPHIRQIENSLSATALNTKAFRHDPGQPRDFKTIFSGIAGRSVRLQIEDPYLASGDRNRGALIDFLRMLQDLNVRIVSLTLAWRPVRPGPGYAEERPEEQQRDLSERLRKIGLGGGIVHFKPRTSRFGHFHDRVVTASLDGDTGKKTLLRWDITSGIDNFMERHRQCSVFFTERDAA
jgi:hypothetical protein